LTAALCDWGRTTF